MRKNAIFRIRIITGVVLFLSLVLVARLYHIQIIQSETYKSQGERQYVHTVQDLYSRGSIYFSTKDDEKVSAATVKSGYLLSIDPTRIEDINGTYEKLNAIVEIDKGMFIQKASQTERTYNEILSRISTEDADKIEALGLSGVQRWRTQWRY